MAAGDFVPFREEFANIGGFDVEGAVDFWTDAFRYWSQRFGPFAGSKVLGTVAGASPLGPTLESYVLVRFENGARLISFTQGAEGPRTGFYLQTVGPAALPASHKFVPTSEAEFATFNFVFESATRVRFEIDEAGRVKGLRLPGRGEALYAEKAF